MLLKRKWSVICIAIALVVFAAGCKKKAGPPPPPPPPPKVVEAPPPPAAPDIAEFSAEPSSIERGGSSTLKWTVTNANQITIDNGVGSVQATGSRSVYPTDTTTYITDLRRGSCGARRRGCAGASVPMLSARARRDCGVRDDPLARR